MGKILAISTVDKLQVFGAGAPVVLGVHTFFTDSPQSTINRKLCFMPSAEITFTTFTLHFHSLSPLVGSDILSVSIHAQRVPSGPSHTAIFHSA